MWKSMEAGWWNITLPSEFKSDMIRIETLRIRAEGADSARNELDDDDENGTRVKKE
jgi:hypothetical protein